MRLPHSAPLGSGHPRNSSSGHLSESHDQSYDLSHDIIITIQPENILLNFGRIKLIDKADRFWHCLRPLSDSPHLSLPLLLSFVLLRSLIRIASVVTGKVL